ncbi:MAG: hypothetical protein M0036_18890 [Desulfobacteraceae bacterium]|nr:hypothetical protein [Desulfobacteraceae bacterium]
MTQRTEGAALAQELYAKAFTGQRDPRSVEYKAGVRAALMFRLAGVAIPRPYTAGTAQADAFYSGIDEGHRIFREHEAEKNGD